MMREERVKQMGPWGILLSAVLAVGCQQASTGPQALPGHDHPPPEAGAKASEPKPPEAGVVSVAIRNFVYEPATVSIRVGETVRWSNYDAAPHDAVALTGSWKTPLLKINESAGQVYTEPGVYPYYCTVHPAMRGTVEVRE